jgi:hypothetical protein
MLKTQLTSCKKPNKAKAQNINDFHGAVESRLELTGLFTLKVCRQKGLESSLKCVGGKTKGNQQHPIRMERKGWNE